MPQPRIVRVQTKGRKENRWLRLHFLLDRNSTEIRPKFYDFISSFGLYPSSQEECKRRRSAIETLTEAREISSVGETERRLAMAVKIESPEGMEALTASGWRETMTPPKIKSAATADEAAVIAVIPLAFSTDPVVRWAYPDPHQYFTHFPPFVRAFGGKAFAHGSAYYVDGYAGAALWLPPEVHPNDDELSAILEHTVTEWERRD